MSAAGSIPLVKPGDKASIYLNPYHLNFSRANPWDKSEGDYIWLPENLGYQMSDGVPDGLRIRTEQEMTNIGSHALLEVQKGGYEFDGLVCAPVEDPKFEEMLEKLDNGKSQMLVTYTNMLPSKFLLNGLPSEELLERARKYKWRIALITLFADPHSYGLTWKSEYIHFGQAQIKEAVHVTVTDPTFENFLRDNPVKPKRKGFFQSR